MIFHITYYYLATGMEGHADTKDHGNIEATTRADAIEKVVLTEYPNGCTPEAGWTLDDVRDFLRSCLKATWVPALGDVAYWVRQYRPGFVELSTDPEQDYVSTLDELLALPWVNMWSTFPAFDHFAVDLSSPVHQLLMAIKKSGEFWVVATVDLGLDMSPLPVWVAARRSNDIR